MTAERRTAVAVCLMRLFVGGILFYAGFIKAVRPAAEFAAAIAAYQLVPASLAAPLAVAVPWIEMWVGTFLMAGFMPRLSATAAVGLSLVFLISVGSALARGIDLASCGCFGPDVLSPRHTIIIDAALLLLSLALFALSRRQILSIENWIGR